MPPKKRLGEILIEKGLITEEHLEQALAEQSQTGELLGSILLKRYWVKERDLLVALSEQFSMAFISLKNKNINWDFVRGFSPDLILDYGCFPVSRDDWSVTVAIVNPFDERVLRKCEEEARGLKVKFVLALKDEIKGVIQEYREWQKNQI